MTKQRLDQALTARGLTSSRSQAESWIKLGKVTVDGQVINKPGIFVSSNADIQLMAVDQYVSRAGLKLASVATTLKLDFKNKVVLDVGSSTGGFTDFALQHGAKKVIAVDVGTNQMHPKLRRDERVEVHEQTDIRNFPKRGFDLVLIDVSFISLRNILPHISKLITQNSLVVAMAKPQFETGITDQKNRGVVKNETIRRSVLKDFEDWVQKLYKIVNKADSEVLGAKGNKERFYILKPLR